MRNTPQIYAIFLQPPKFSLFFATKAAKWRRKRLNEGESGKWEGWNAYLCSVKRQNRAANLTINF